MVMNTLRVTLFSLGLILLTGIAYPLAVTAIAQIAFPQQANGSLMERDGMVIGAALIAQKFERAEYFHPRPSAAGAGYEANNSGASNLSVTSKILQETYAERTQALGGGDIPADLITASGSGLDPHITPEGARYQAARIAQARHIPLKMLQTLIDEHTEGRSFGILGAPRVNVLSLNLALDKMPPALETTKPAPNE